LNRKYRNHVMVATVTGIAPFVSMLRYALAMPGDGARFYVLQGASYVDEFGYDAELAAMHPSVRFVPTCSRPQEPRNAAWRGATGRVNAIVEQHVREWALQPADTCIYVCGNPQMIDDVKTRYASTGFHVEAEGFWKKAEPAAIGMSST
jgi:ferredoxin--NADP+ reductase